MNFPGYFEDHIIPDKIHVLNVSFQVDSLDRQRGGVAGNIAYNLGLLGEPCRLMGTVGQDFDEYAEILRRLGVDTSGIKYIPDINTASAFITTDMADNQITGFFPGAMANAGEQSATDFLDGVSLAVVSPTDPAAMVRHVREFTEAEIPYVYDPGQQIIVTTPDALRDGICGATIVIGNDYEIAMIEEKTGWDRERIIEEVPIVVTTLGELGSQIAAEGELYTIPSAPTDTVVDPTGAGDAYRAGLITGMNRGLPLEIAGCMGSLAATFAIEQLGTQAHRYTIDEFLTRWEITFPDFLSDVQDVMR